MKDGGPAFPCVPLHPDVNQMKNMGGMSLRDYFAAAALQGLIASGSATKEWIGEYGCKSAYNLADGMLAEREKK